jgi:hypothetical protein
MSNAQRCNWKSNREVATLLFGRQPFQYGSWNTQTSVCWIRFILYLVQCLDIVSSTQLCHILHRVRLQYCCNLLIDYKTSYYFQHAGLSVTVITIDAILEDWILFSEFNKYNYWLRCQDQSRFHSWVHGVGFWHEQFQRRWFRWCVHYWHKHTNPHGPVLWLFYMVKILPSLIPKWSLKNDIEDE